MSEPHRPHIVAITSHDVGRHLGCYGVPTVQTRRLDALAADGARMAQHFCTFPMCSPSRASLFTGRWPHSHGVIGLIHGMFQFDLNPDERHLAAILGDAGYHTAVLGVQHATRRPAEFGFETIGRGAGDATGVADAAGELLGQLAAGDRPFYAQIGFREPHRLPGPGFGDMPPDDSLGVTVPPWLVDEPSAREDLARFQGAIRHLDVGVGRVLDAIDALGLRDQTLVIFAADHGIPYPRAKASVYDPGLHAAAILRWPAGGITQGLVCEALTSHVDVMPTILELLGLAPEPRMQGRSFAAWLRGEAYTPNEAVYGENGFTGYMDLQRSIRTATHKLIVNFLPNRAIYNATQSWRPPTRPVVPADPAGAKHPLVELYDIRNDPWERHDLGEDPASAEVRADLLRRLHDWMVRTDDFLLKGLPTPPMYHQAIRLLREAR